MKLWKKILIVVSIILCVGLLGASIARTAVKPVTVGRSGSGNSASTPAATEPAEPQIEYVNDGKIYLLVQDDTEDSGYNVAVYEDDVLVEPLYVSPSPAPSNAKPGGDLTPDFIPTKVYRVTPGNSEFRFVQIEAKSETKADPHEDVALFDVFVFSLPRTSVYEYECIYDNSYFLSHSYSIKSSAFFVCIALSD